MTAQFAEALRHEGEGLAMCTQPLNDYFALAGKASPFTWNNTALRRGYVGHWEVVDGRLPASNSGFQPALADWSARCGGVSGNEASSTQPSRYQLCATELASQDAVRSMQS